MNWLLLFQSFLESSIWAIFSRKMVTAWRRGHVSYITGRRRRGTVSCSCLACSASLSTTTAAVLTTTATIWRQASTATGAATTASPESVSLVWVELALEQRLPRSSLSDTQHSHLLRTAPSSCCRHGSLLSGRAKGGAFYQLFPPNWFHHRRCSEPLGCLWPYPYLYLYLCLAAPATTLRW